MGKNEKIYEYLDKKSLADFMLFRWEKDLTIFLACYNEENNIIGTFETLTSALKKTKLSWEIIVIDDASSDNSKELVSRYIRENPGYSIMLKARKKNTGLAQNYIDCAFLAKGKYYKLVSGDDTEPEDTFVKIFNAVGKADMVIPYYTEIKGRPLLRTILSKTYVFLVNILSGYKIKYYNGGAIHLTYNILRWHGDFYGFSFQAEVIARLLDQGMSYIEIPVTSRERSGGKSTAFQLKNFFSVGYLFLELLLRRFGRICHFRKG
jgi:glycosyltransferase involved in cell wall biosynthesis